MGERKGTNKYYPPDYDPGSGGLNKFLGTHALRERARKLHLGILIIRFEMPYNIWCDGCGNHIGMGVRILKVEKAIEEIEKKYHQNLTSAKKKLEDLYKEKEDRNNYSYGAGPFLRYNAEKTKIGMYYSTPIYKFRMKCHLCDNHFEIKTDPGNLDYLIVSGARRQENRWDPTQNGQVVPDDKETSARLFDDAMFKLEHGTADKSTAKRVAPTLGKLINRNSTAWKDDFSANCALRAQFRVKKKELKAKEKVDNALLKKTGLNITLLPENDEDIHLASLLSLKSSKSAKERQLEFRKKISLLPSTTSLLTKSALGITNEKTRSLVAADYNSSEDD